MNSINLFALLVVVAVAAANDLAGVDPNTLSCDPEGQIYLLLPHFTDCNKFFICANGKEVPLGCPGSTIFDFELQTCNWEWATKCWLRTDPDEIDGSGDEPTIVDEFMDSRSVDILNDASPVNAEKSQGALNVILNCRTLQSASKQVAYSGDCQRYWRCENGLPQSAYCSDGLYFNPTTRQCDFEANTKCHVAQEDELQGEFIVYE